jgi:hypothetical protein
MAGPPRDPDGVLPPSDRGHERASTGRAPISLHEPTVVLKGHPRPDRPSRPAIGAAVEVRLPDGRRLVSQVDGGSGHPGKRAPDIHLGLGNVEASALLKVDVRWRGADGKMRSRTMQVPPGWHTVWLGQSTSEGDLKRR